MMNPVYTNGKFRVIPLIMVYAVVGVDGIVYFRRDTVEDAVEDADMLAVAQAA